MRMSRFFFTLMVLCIFSCSTAYKGPIYEGSPPIGNWYGKPGIKYGEDKHPGIDYTIPKGTPIIAVSDGVVAAITRPFPFESYGGGFFVGVDHENYFRSIYGHLTKHVVQKGQPIKRGELIGYSGASNDGYKHLHFGLLRIGTTEGHLLSNTHNPGDFWLDGKPQCFDPQIDYSKYSAKEITLPVACGEYQRRLLMKK